MKSITFLCIVFIFLDINLACDLNDKNNIKLLETYINYSIPEKYGRVRNKLYSFFGGLKEAHLVQAEDKLPPDVNLLIVLLRQSLVYEFSSPTEGPYSIVRRSKKFRLNQNERCKYLGQKYEQELLVLNKINRKLEEQFASKRKNSMQINCNLKCDMLCLKLSCPTGENCPDLLSDDLCATRIPCPKGFTAHWLEPPLKVKEEEESRYYLGNFWNKDDRNIEFLDREFYSQKRWPRKTELDIELDISKVKDETITAMLEVLDYYKEDITPLKDGIILPYSHITDIINRSKGKDKIIRDGMEAIIARLSPADSSCWSFMERLKKYQQEGKGIPQSEYDEIETDITKSLKTKRELGDGCDINKCREREKGKACGELFNEKVDCSFSCRNNAGCGEYQCRNVLYW